MFPFWRLLLSLPLWEKQITQVLFFCGTWPEMVRVTFLFLFFFFSFSFLFLKFDFFHPIICFDISSLFWIDWTFISVNWFFGFYTEQNVQWLFNWFFPEKEILKIGKGKRYEKHLISWKKNKPFLLLPEELEDPDKEKIKGNIFSNEEILSQTYESEEKEE